MKLVHHPYRQFKIAAKPYHFTMPVQALTWEHMSGHKESGVFV